MAKIDWISILSTYAIPAVFSLAILILAVLAASWLSLLIRTIGRRRELDQTIVKFLARCVRWGIYIVAATMVLEKFGFEAASLSVVLGTMGLAIGLALQGTLANFASGVMLLVFRPFKVSDVISSNGITGKVDEIGLFATNIDTVDNRRVIIPNKNIFSNVIQNISFHEIRRLDIKVDTALGEGTSLVKKMLEDVANSSNFFLKNKKAEIILSSVSNAQAKWTIKIWVKKHHFDDALNEMVQELEKTLAEKLISITPPSAEFEI